MLPNTTVSADFTLRNLGNIPMQGIISTPVEFELSQNGNPLSDDYHIRSKQVKTQFFTISYLPEIQFQQFIRIW